MSTPLRWDGDVEPPEVFRTFDTPVANLPVGNPGKVGALEVDLVQAEGATRIRRRSSSGPLCLLHPLYLDPQRPGMAFLHTVQLGGGVLQGDRYRLAVHAGPSTSTHVTSQAATKLYRMDRNYAAQLVELAAEPDAFLEYLPDPTIPFRGARFHQRIRATVAESATMILGEVLLPGRVAHDERHAYTVLNTDLEVRRPDGTPLFADRTRLAPPAGSPRSPARLGDHDVLATLHVVSRELEPTALADRLWSVIREEEDVWAGVSELPHRCGAVVRMLGGRSRDTIAAMHRTWDRARLGVAGAPAPNLRKS